MAASEPRASRRITIAAGQLGPIHLSSTRSSVIDRMKALLDSAASQKVQLVVFPELALTTFFPRYLLSPEDLAGYFDIDDPSQGGITASPNVKPLFDHARALGIDICVGYAERSPQGDGKPPVDYNACVYYSAQQGKVVGKYRKVHLPGAVEPYTAPGAFQQLEKRYFRPGDLGFPAFRAPGLVKGALKKGDAADLNASQTMLKGDPIVGMLICNDRRWAEGWRVYGLQGTEIVCCGYNTTAFATNEKGQMLEDMTPEEAEEDVLLHHRLSCQGNSYMNACFSINVAKTGAEDGNPLVGGTMIIHPTGRIIKEATTKEDELVVAQIDLEDCRRGKGKVFAFEKHRRPEHYGMILERVGAIEPELLE